MVAIPTQHWRLECLDEHLYVPKVAAYVVGVVAKLSGEHLMPRHVVFTYLLSLRNTILSPPRGILLQQRCICSLDLSFEVQNRQYFIGKI